MARTKDKFFGEKKTEVFQVMFTKTGLNTLDWIASQSGFSRGHLLECLCRWAEKDGRYLDVVESFNDETDA